MRLGGEIDDGAGLVFGEQGGDQRLVQQVGMHEHMTRVGGNAG